MKIGKFPQCVASQCAIDQEFRYAPVLRSMGGIHAQMIESGVV